MDSLRRIAHALTEAVSSSADTAFPDVSLITRHTSTVVQLFCGIFPCKMVMLPGYAGLNMFSSMPEWIKSFPANFALLASLVGFLAALYANYLRFRTLRAKQAKAKELVEQVRKRSEMQLEKASKIDQAWVGLLGSLISTSTAQAPAGIAEGYAAIEELRKQISVIEQKIQTHRNEIVEVTKIDPVLEATIKASIENLTKRIEFLEKTRLEKWDVALIVFQVLTGLGVIFAIIFGIIKYLHP